MIEKLRQIVTRVAEAPDLSTALGYAVRGVHDAIGVDASAAYLVDPEDGHLVLSDRPGWGTEPNEDGLAAHPPRDGGGMLVYGQDKRGAGH